jgi:hypothetical protein
MTCVYNCNKVESVSSQRRSCLTTSDPCSIEITEGGSRTEADVSMERQGGEDPGDEAAPLLEFSELLSLSPVRCIMYLERAIDRHELSYTHQHMTEILSSKYKSVAELDKDPSISGGVAPHPILGEGRLSCLGIPSSRKCAITLQTEASTRLEEEVERLGRQGSIRVEEAHAIYSLAARLEYPLMADTEASMGQLLRQCNRLRVSGEGETRRAYLDVLQIIAGAYFGQDMTLRNKYRDHGVHV